MLYKTSFQEQIKKLVGKNGTRRWRRQLCCTFMPQLSTQYINTPQEFGKLKFNCLLRRSAATPRWHIDYQPKYILEYMMLYLAHKENFSAFILTEGSRERMVSTQSDCCMQQRLGTPGKPVGLLLCPSGQTITHALSCLSSKLYKYFVQDRRAPQHEKSKEVHLRPLKPGQFGNSCKWRV